MECATRLEITFKSGDTITYREGEWDEADCQVKCNEKLHTEIYHPGKFWGVH